MYFLRILKVTYKENLKMKKTEMQEKALTTVQDKTCKIARNELESFNYSTRQDMQNIRCGGRFVY